MITALELKQLYGVIRDSGHFDPLGFLARAVYASGGDPDYADSNGRYGFTPLNLTEVRREMPNTSDIYSLMGNTTTAVLLDILRYEDSGQDPAVLHTRYFLDDGGEAFLDAREEIVRELVGVVSPRRATLKDFVEVLKDVDLGRGKQYQDGLNLLIEKLNAFD